MMNVSQIDIASEMAYPTPAAHSQLLPMLLLSLARQKIAPNVSDRFKKEYDYIVVGGGSAGSVIASRLSEIACVNVLLLEAGKLPPLLTEVPAFSGSFLDSDIDWAYNTEPQKHTGRCNRGRTVFFSSGKALGGSSIINGNFYVRGNRKNFDDWASMGATGWSFSEVLHYFKKSEDNQNARYVAEGYHGKGGLLTVDRPETIKFIRRKVRDAAIGMGYQFVDSNGAQQYGFYNPQGTLRGGQRCSTAKAYLVPAENRTNLDILVNAYVRSISIVNGTATGVVFDYKNMTHTVTARKEVILSAGTINTPQLLILSGIGPKKTLKKFNIPINAVLPVGKNFVDHPRVTYSFELDTNKLNLKTDGEKYMRQYIHNRTGYYGSLAGITQLAFLRNQIVTPKYDFPNYQLYFAPLFTTAITSGLDPKVYDAVYKPYENGLIMVCSIAPIQPKSKGYISINSTDPYDPPIIDPNYFGNNKDMKVTVQALKTCNKILKSKPLRQIGVKPFTTVFPGCENYVNDEDRYLECFARSYVETWNHPVGTARMGNVQDKKTVVDPELRVKNIKNLRVVDASIMPTITSGNTNAPTIMIAEKAADMIKKTIVCNRRTKIHRRTKI